MQSKGCLTRTTNVTLQTADSGTNVVCRCGDWHPPYVYFAFIMSMTSFGNIVVRVQVPTSEPEMHEAHLQWRNGRQHSKTATTRYQLLRPSHDFLTRSKNYQVLRQSKKTAAADDDDNDDDDDYHDN